ncbi:MAG TPA: ester cyclase [Propionibacteriaceae bacterium]|nr:ester cyclase [Propionibacteriaceae bacterium]
MQRAETAEHRGDSFGPVTRPFLLLDLPATGRRVEIDEMIMFRVVDGLVVEAWEVWD